MPYMPQKVADALRVRLESASDYDVDPKTGRDRCMECHAVHPEGSLGKKRFPHLRDCIMRLIEGWTLKHTNEGGT